MANPSNKGKGGELVKFSTVLKNQKNRELLRGALTRGLDMDRFVKCAWIQVTTNEAIFELAQSNPTSVFRAMLQCAQMGLYPDGISGDAYLVPFKNQCVAIRGYRGLIRQFSEHNPDSAPMPVVFDEIRQNDEWDYERGATPKLMHKPAKEQRGEVTHYYAAVRFKDGSVWPKVMTVEDVEAFSKYSKTDKFWNSPHENTRRWMRIKTVVRQLFKEVPIPSMSREQIDREEAVETGVVEVDDYLTLVSGEGPHVYGNGVKKTEVVATAKTEPKKTREIMREIMNPNPKPRPEPEPDLPIEPEYPLHSDGTEAPPADDKLFE